MKNSFLACSVYAFALSAMILSHRLSNAIVEIWVARPYTLGTHGEAWEDWHGVGCLFLALTNLAAHRWTEPRPRRDIAAATAVIYGGWALQNLVFMFGSRFTPAMWLNVAGCALAAAASVVTARAQHGAIVAPTAPTRA